MKSLWIAACCLALSTASAAEQSDSAVGPLFRVDFALADVPANGGASAYWPSMAQSRSLATSLCESGNYLVSIATSGVRNPFARAGLQLGLEACELLVLAYVPGGSTWMHEEYHRAVLSRRGIPSYDGVYDFNLDATAVSVYRVSDESLAMLKAEHPEDLVRCEAAGYEGEVDLAGALLRDGMLRGARLYEPMALYALLSNSFYIWYNTSNESDGEIAEFNERETDPLKRDIVGWDFSAWTYDLHRPNEPYAARGSHPSGTGTNRYITWAQLTSSEQGYLRLQAALSLVNFVRPQLYGVKPLCLGVGGRRSEYTAGFVHYLTPFGFMLGGYGMARTPGCGIAVGINVYANGKTALPGIDVSLYDVPVSFASKGLFWSPRMSMWLQPDGQSFYGNAAAAGALISQRLDMKLRKGAGMYTEIEAKTKGWVAGTVDLGAALSLRAGAVAEF
jgi:hypothetical protein